MTPELIINILLILTATWGLGSLFSRFGLFGAGPEGP